MIPIHLPTAMEARFREQASAAGQSVEEYLSRAVLRLMEEEEARQDYQTGAQALARHEPVFSLDELEQRLGLAG